MKKILYTAGKIALLLGIYLAIQGIASLAVSLSYAVGLMREMMARGDMPDAFWLAQELLRQVGAQTPWILLISAVITTPIYYLIYHRRRQELFTFVRLRGIHPAAIFVLIVFALAVYVIVDMLLTMLSGLPALRHFFDAYGQLSSVIFGGSFVMTFLSVGIVAPIFEELLFRGLVFGELRKRTRVRGAIVIQALLFGLYHLNVLQSSYAFLIGLLLGYVYYRSDSILAPVIMHITINTAGVLLQEFAPLGLPEGWGPAVAVAAVALVCLTGAFIMTHKSFKRCMDDRLHTPDPGQLPFFGPSGGEQDRLEG